MTTPRLHAAGRLAFGLATVLVAAPEIHAQSGVPRDTMPLIAFRISYPDSALDRARYLLGDSVVFLSRAVLLSDEDLARVAPMEEPTGEFFLRLTCHPEADERLRRTVADHVGRHLAIVIEDRVQSAPVIQSGIGCIGLDIATTHRDSEAARLRSLVRERWPK